MAFDDNEVDECGAERDPPPSYQNLLHQEANSITQNIPLMNLTSVQSRNFNNCMLCRCCHQKQSQDSEQATESLDRLVTIMEGYTLTYDTVTAITTVWGIMCIILYFLYLWLTYSSSTIIEDRYRRAFANANITEDIQKILLDRAQNGLVLNLKRCIFSKL